MLNREHKRIDAAYLYWENVSVALYSFCSIYKFTSEDLTERKSTSDRAWYDGHSIPQNPRATETCETILNTRKRC